MPNGISTVFPGEEHGLHSSPEEYGIAVNSYLNHRNEGGNELVFLNLAGARLGSSIWSASKDRSHIACFRTEPARTNC